MVVVPLRTDEIYPLYIRNLNALDGISAILLDFALDQKQKIGALTIEEVLDYRAVREALRYPGFLPVPGELNENDAYTIAALGVQALILTAGTAIDQTSEQIKQIRTLQEKTYQEDKDKDTTSISARK